MVKISASVLSARDDLKDIIEELDKISIDYIHIDVMDGIFVPNTAITYEEAQLISSITNKPLDVHLMVEDYDSYIYNYSMLNTECITVHYEVMKDTKILSKIKSYGIKCGISIKPDTDVELIYDLLSKVDLVLIMSVQPGFGGQTFIESTDEKIRKLKEKIKELNLDVLISVDGGININSAEICINNGADILVIGSALINSKDKDEFINKINCKANN